MPRHAKNRILYLHGYDHDANGYLMPEIELLVRQLVEALKNCIRL